MFVIARNIQERRSPEQISNQLINRDYNFLSFSTVNLFFIICLFAFRCTETHQHYFHSYPFQGSSSFLMKNVTITTFDIALLDDTGYPIIPVYQTFANVMHLFILMDLSHLPQSWCRGRRRRPHPCAAAAAIPPFDHIAGIT